MYIRVIYDVSLLRNYATARIISSAISASYFSVKIDPPLVRPFFLSQRPFRGKTMVSPRFLRKKALWICRRFDLLERRPRWKDFSMKLSESIFTDMNSYTQDIANR